MNWLGIRPGSDGLFVLALIHELLKADKIDLDYLVRYTTRPGWVIRAAGTAQDGLFARTSEGQPLAWDQGTKTPTSAYEPELNPATHRRDQRLPDGRLAVPAFQLMAERYLDPRYSPDAVAEGDGHSGGHDAPHRGRAGACGLCPGNPSRHPLDRLAGPAATIM